MRANFNWTDEEKQIFSQQQIQICEMKRQGRSQIDIENIIGVNPQAISSAICATLSGNRWEPHTDKGGVNSYIGDVDVSVFKQRINDFGLNLDCLKTIEAIEIVYELRCQRYSRAKFISNLVSQKSILAPRYIRCLRQLEPYFPCESWLTNFAKSVGIILKTPDSLEEARRKFCTTRIITSFFTKHGNLLRSVHAENIWNADESSSSSSKKYKVLISNKDSYAVTSVSKHEAHMTGMYCFNAIGVKLDPFIILPNIENLPNECKDLNAFLTSQKSGWMTSKLFTIFCIYFSAKISHYRLQLSQEISSEPTILIVDNHPSRINPFAIEVLKQNNIILLTMPPHTSHLLQPFDVTVAKSLKSAMNKNRIDREVNNYSMQFTSNAARARYITVSSIINAWNSIKIETLKNGFKFTGIYPLNSQIVLSKR